MSLRPAAGDRIPLTMPDTTPNGQLPACEKNPIAEARKQPPPEKPEAIWTRTYVITSFWVVIVLLGLPMWWQTTSIYRAQLPYQEMLDWSQGRVRGVRFSCPKVLVLIP